MQFKKKFWLTLLLSSASFNLKKKSFIRNFKNFIQRQEKNKQIKYFFPRLKKKKKILEAERERFTIIFETPKLILYTLQPI